MEVVVVFHIKGSNRKSYVIHVFAWICRQPRHWRIIIIFVETVILHSLITLWTTFLSMWKITCILFNILPVLPSHTSIHNAHCWRFGQHFLIPVLLLCSCCARLLNLAFCCTRSQWYLLFKPWSADVDDTECRLIVK